MRQRTRRPDCAGKHCYVSRRHARNDARALSQRQGEHLSSYWCSRCAAYHVGHTPWWRRRRDRRWR